MRERKIVMDFRDFARQAIKSIEADIGLKTDGIILMKEGGYEKNREIIEYPDYVEIIIKNKLEKEVDLE